MAARCSAPICRVQPPTRWTVRPCTSPRTGGFDASKAQLIAGNFKKLVYSIRQDVTVKLLDQGVIQDPSTKEIVYNLAQQDMVALRVDVRMGWALPNPPPA